MDFFEVEAYEGAGLQSDFVDGKIKLVPIVFSHGSTASRGYYSTHSIELAS